MSLFGLILFWVVIFVFFIKSGGKVSKRYFFVDVLLGGRRGLRGKGAVLNGESCLLESFTVIDLPTHLE